MKRSTKTRRQCGVRRFQIRLKHFWHSNYLDRIARLQGVLKMKPRTVRIELIGVGDIPPDSALLFRSALLSRSPGTRIITNARSSLKDAAVMVWLLGDTRIIRDDARLYFRRADVPDDVSVDRADTGKEDEPKFRDSFSEFDPEEGDYARVLQVINEFLPVKELAGRLIDVRILRQFGLVDNARVDDFLATAFAKSPVPVTTR